MNLISKDELKALMQRRDEACVSLYLPTQRAGAETRENRIRFKNRLDEAEDLLGGSGLRPPDISELLDPARELLDDQEFWKYQSDGLATFINPGTLRYYRLPLEFEPLTIVSDRFHIKPLLPLFSRNGKYYILALSQNEVRLLQATAYSASEVSLEDMPTSLAEALGYDDPEKQLQFHTETQRTRGDRPAMFHGHGVGTNDQKENILRFFHKIDAGLQEVFREEAAPLVLAAVDYLIPIYQEANSYAHLLDEAITGNPEELSAKELQAAAWEIVGPRFLQQQQVDLDRFQQVAGTDLASSELREVAPASFHGRVEALFVALDEQIWGSYDPETDLVEIHPEKRPGDEDLLDFAALHTLINGGTVYVVDRAEVPSGELLAAIYRY